MSVRRRSRDMQAASGEQPLAANVEQPAARQSFLQRLISCIASQHIPLATLIKSAGAIIVLVNVLIALGIRRATGSSYAAWGYGIVCLAAAGAWFYKHGYGAVGVGPRPSMAIIERLRSKRGWSPGCQNVVRFVVISDTHNAHAELDGRMPPGDVLLHCGDLTYRGTREELEAVCAWLDAQPYAEKFAIAGNHDLSLDPASYDETWRDWQESREDPVALRSLLASHCTVLENTAMTTKKGGVKVWGSPYQPGIPGRRMAFNLTDETESAAIWSKIPEDADVVLSHGPAFQLVDRIFAGAHVGDKVLRKELLERVRPRFHCCGHIHEAWGAAEEGATTFINAASCTLLYQARHDPIVFDIEV